MAVGLGGTALGGLATADHGWVLVTMTASFVGALALAFVPNGRGNHAPLDHQANNE